MEHSLTTTTTNPTTSLAVAQPAATITGSVSLTTMEIVEAAQSGKKIAELDAKQLTKLANDLINEAIIRTGYRNTFSADPETAASERQLVQGMIAADLRKYYPYLTYIEVQLAIRMGLNGDFKTSPDEITIIAPASFMKWLKAYRETAKPKAIREYMPIRNALTRESDVEDIVEADAQEVKKIYAAAAILAHWKKVQATGQWLPYGQFDALATDHYKLLDEAGLIIHTPDQKWQMLEEELISEGKRLRLNLGEKAKNPKEFNEFMLAIEKLQNGESASFNKDSKYFIQAKINCQKRAFRESLMAITDENELLTKLKAT